MIIELSAVSFQPENLADANDIPVIAHSHQD
jgi:hypothetical protein